jgi:ketosteroid isomerase-like protein
MTEKTALQLVQRYMDGWRKNNLETITSCLINDCIVIESHGPTYHGIAEMARWFELWMEADSQINRWDVRSFYFCEKEQTAFFEWDFACVSNKVEYAFPGMSLIKCKNEKIAFIHEYRMTSPAYPWLKETLQSE